MEIRTLFILQDFPPLNPLFQVTSRRTIFYFVWYVSVDDPHETWHSSPTETLHFALNQCARLTLLLHHELGSTCCKSAKPHSSSSHASFCA